MENVTEEMMNKLVTVCNEFNSSGVKCRLYQHFVEKGEGKYIFTVSLEFK